MDDHVPNVRSVCEWVVGRSLGVTGGARGEDQVGDVAGLHAGGPGRGHRGVDGITCGEEVTQADDRHHPCSVLGLAPAALVVAQQHDAAERAHVLSRQHGGVVGPQEAAHRDEGRRTGVAHDVGRLAALEARVERHQYGTGPQEAERTEHPLGAVGRPDGDPVTHAHARGHEAAGETVHLGRQSCVGEAHPAVNQGLPSSVPQRGVVDQTGHRPPDQVGPRVLLVLRHAADPHAAHGC